MTTLKIYPTGSLDVPYIAQIDYSEPAPPGSGLAACVTADKDSSKNVADDANKGWWARWTGSATANASATMTATGAAQQKRFLSNEDVETIILLDVSGSMGQNVRRVVTDYLPNALESAGYAPGDTIQLVVFGSRARAQQYTMSQLRESRQDTEGCTYMAHGIKEIERLLKQSECRNIRLISISDGELHDQLESVGAAQRLAEFLKEGGYLISSTAIRLFTSTSQPDTRGLSSMLQLDTISGDTDKFILDVNSRDPRESIIETFSSLLNDDLGANARLVLSDSAAEPIFQQTPWSKPTREVHLKQGVNTFWLRSLPESLAPEDAQSREITGGGISISFKPPGSESPEVWQVLIYKGDRLDFSSYNGILKEKVDYFLKRLRILKVLNTQEAQREIESIVNYFQDLEKAFVMNDPEVRDVLNNTLQSRLAFFRGVYKKRKRSVSLQMAEIANDDKVAQLNSAQQASYLRSADTSSNSRALARRALKQGLEFDVVARKEVRAMKEHLKDLAGIDDAEHYVSFYSQETTLSGIQTVCELCDEDDTIEGVSALEILQLLNIVGIPCIGQIGDYPDPKTYHIEELLLGSFVSMADVMIVKQGGHNLDDPFSGKRIINVVPFYDDDRIQQFLMKWAPTLLEYTASLGMRNMILEVPHTYKYTVVGGLWNMARRLDTEKTEKNVDVFTKLVRTYLTAVDGLFDHVLPLIRAPSDADLLENRSMYISNNGITNMISPLITVAQRYVEGTDHESIKWVPNVLRALYSFEHYQLVRKFYRSDDDKIAKRKAMLDQLLGIDYDRRGTPLPPLFEQAREKGLKHHSEAHPDVQQLESIISKCWWVDYLVNLPDFLVNSFKGTEGQKAIMSMPQKSEPIALSALGLTDSGMTLQEFKFYCIVQSFLYPSKAERVDAARHNMLIEDCGNLERMRKMVSDYVQKQYRADYQSRLARQKEKERELLARELVEKMALTPHDLEGRTEFLKLFREGLSRNHVSVRIYDTYQLGYTILRDRLLDPNSDVLDRKYKMSVFVMGVDSKGETVWNNGNALRSVPLSQLREAFIAVGLEEYWENQFYPAFKKRNKYMYRDSDKPNRHTHCNSKVSYWALGYKTVGAYFAEINEAEQQEYMRVHTHCCGIWDGKLVKPA